MGAACIRHFKFHTLDTIAFHTVLTDYDPILVLSPVLFNEVLPNEGDGYVFLIQPLGGLFVLMRTDCLRGITGRDPLGYFIHTQQ